MLADYFRSKPMDFHVVLLMHKVEFETNSRGLGLTESVMKGRAESCGLFENGIHYVYLYIDVCNVM